MAIQIRRGTNAQWESNKSNIVAGEPAITTDTGRLMVGTGTGAFAEFVNKDSIADYVVERGTSSIWTWEKWNSGKSVCWGTLDIEVTAWSAWGSLYEGTPTSGPTYFPSNLFIAVPVCHANISIANTSGGVISCEMGRVTNDRVDYIIPIRPTTTGVPIQYKAFILAIGKWK